MYNEIGDNMFENLGDRLQNAVNKIKGYGKITEDNISDVTREIRLALLEADVNYKVVNKSFFVIVDNMPSPVLAVMTKPPCRATAR